MPIVISLNKWNLRINISFFGQSDLRIRQLRINHPCKIEEKQAIYIYLLATTCDKHVVNDIVSPAMESPRQKCAVVTAKGTRN